MKRSALKCLLLVSSLLAGSFPARAAEITYKRTLEDYVMPDVVLINQDGVKVPFKKLMESDKLVVVEFIFGTCTTICPVLSVGYTNLQQKLGPRTQAVSLVSVTIDPENDSPKVLKDYLKRYRAKPGWDFFTGSREDIDKVMHAFNAYISNKMYHYPLTLIRSPKDGKWIRIMGLMSSSEFVAECEKVGIN
jgi:protein SCO1